MAKAATTAEVKKAPAKAPAKASVKRTKVRNVPFAHAVGRRKRAIARVWLRKGKGEILVNGRALQEYFPVITSFQDSQRSFVAVPMTSDMLADVKVVGGGYTAQASAVKLGIARALLQFDETLKPEMRQNGFLTVDSRTKERKKPGQKGARKKFQFTKR